MIVGIYARVSTQEQANNYSISEQIDRLKKYCDSLGWTIYRQYIDPGYSGASTDRPGLTALITDIKTGKLQKVVVYKLDRLSRSQLDTLYLIEKVFLGNNVDFVSMSENFDTASPFGKAMIGILAVFAQLEREQIKERLMMGKVARAKSGKFCGSWACNIGYDYINGELIINEYEKLQVQKIYDLFLSGMPITQIIKTMTEAGYRHKHGTWNDRTIRNVLSSKTYLGYILFKGNWYKGQHEPIITEETHKKAAAIMARRRTAYESCHRPGKVQSILGGLLYCAECGEKYSKKKTHYIRKDGTQRCYYACLSRLGYTGKTCHNKHWTMEDLDKIVFDEIRKLALDETYQPEQPKQINTEKQREKLDKQIARLIDLYAVGGMPLDSIQAKIQALEEQKEALLAAEQPVEKITFDESKHIASGFGVVLDNGNFYQIRTVIESLIDRIEIDGERVSIYWNFM